MRARGWMQERATEAASEPDRRRSRRRLSDRWQGADRWRGADRWQGEGGQDVDAFARSTRAVVHDLRQGIGTVRALVAGLSAFGPGGRGDREEFTLALELVEHQLDVMHGLCRSLLDDALQMRPLPLDHVVREVATAIGRRHDATVFVEADPVWIHGDALALERLVLNLVDNAARAAGPGGVVDVTLDLDEGRPRVVIRDDGPGPTRGHGVPVGLMIVEQIAHAHGAEVVFDLSRPGWTIVEVVFPLRSA